MENSKRLYKDGKNKMIGGVCAGIADRFGFDPTLVRLGTVLLGMMYGTGVVLYIVAMVVMPDKSEIDSEW